MWIVSTGARAHVMMYIHKLKASRLTITPAVQLMKKRHERQLVQYKLYLSYHCIYFGQIIDEIYKICLDGTYLNIWINSSD